MKTSRKVSYGVQALVLLAKLSGENPVSCGIIARHGQMPERFLLQILRRLVEWGILTSARGVDGGYQLARSAVSISMVDIFEAFGFTFVPSVPPLEGLPEESRQLVLAAFNRAAGRAHTELAALTVAHLLSAASSGWPSQVDMSPSVSDAQSPHGS